MPATSSKRLAPLSPINETQVILSLVAFRLVNSLVVRTFFQPDEFFQSLEPAWLKAFGQDQGSWITWEWNNHLRSSLHPLLFAAIYKISDFVASTFQLSPATRATILVQAPKAAQAIVAAVGDFYTWKLATRIYGEDSRGSWATLLATILSPWQWFCSTRTLSNCLETTVTIVALELWPWKWAATSANNDRVDRGLLLSFHKCLALAALACILRPTNIIIWLILASFTLYQISWAHRKIFVRGVLILGSTVLAVSALADRFFYGVWTFPPLLFLKFNVVQSLAVFYGRNDWHYYATQGYPLLLLGYLPFAVYGLYLTLTTRTSTATDKLQTSIRVQLATVCVLMPFALSLISHKEVRFIYPLLPSLHILAAIPLVQFFWPAFHSYGAHYHPRRLIFIFIILVHIAAALYTTTRHASGVIEVMSYLRQQHDLYAPSAKPFYDSNAEPMPSTSVITAGFLMPCHSTPWRSHLVYPTIDAWALSCEPPINLNETQRAVYRDDADQFYDDPENYLRENMAGSLRHFPTRPSAVAGPQFYTSYGSKGPKKLNEWPDYLVFFAQLEPTLKTLLRSSTYSECQRIMNSDAHDDWRRRGDVVVWCLNGDEQSKWRAQTRKKRLEIATADSKKHIARLVEALKSEPAPRSDWFSLRSLMQPASSPLSVEYWKRGFSSSFSAVASGRWPWSSPPSRAQLFLRKFARRQPSAWEKTSAWVSSCFPSWLGGKPNPYRKKRQLTEAELWT